MPVFMKRIAQLLIIIMLCMPVFSMAHGDAGPRGRAPIPPNHQGNVTLADFSSMDLANLSIERNGSVELRRETGYFGLDKFVVTDATNAQVKSAIALDSGGTAMIAWEDNGNGMYTVVNAQRIDTAGNKLGGEIAVSSGTTNQSDVEIAANPSHRFMITWTDHITSSDIVVHALMVDSSGSKYGSEFSVDTISTDQQHSAVAADPAGNFVVVWEDYRGTHSEIYAQRFSGGGVKLGGEIAVTSASSADQFTPSVATDSGGNFIITWVDTSTGKWSLVAQRFDSTGNKIGGKIGVTAPGDVGNMPAIAVDTRDGFVIVYERYNLTNDWDIFAKKYDSSGSQVGGEVTVVIASGAQMFPRIVCDSIDGYTIVWQDGRHPSNCDILAQAYDSAGMANGDPIQVSTDTGNQLRPGTAIDSRDGMIFAWGNDNGGPTGLDVHARRFIRPCSLEGTLTSGILAPAHLRAWNNLSAGAQIGNHNTLAFEYSADAGTSWQPVPANGSLAGAGFSSAMKLRADFGTIENTSSPSLSVMIAYFTTNQPPSVSLPADFTTGNNTPVNILANVADPDNDTITYRWNQTGGQALLLSGLTARNISFTPNRSGVYSFELVVNDGFNDSPPASINVTVLPSDLPDLRLTASDLTVKPLKPRDGETVTLIATVHNTGQADASTFVVRFLVDGAVVGEQTVTTLGKGANITRESSWKAREGTHSLSVVIDPDNHIGELNESNNGAGVALSVAKAEAGGMSMVLVGIVVVMIIVVAVLLAAMMMRRRRPTTVIQYQAPARQAPAAPQASPPPVQGPQGPPVSPPLPASPPPSGPNAAPAAPQAPAQTPPPNVQGPPAGPSQQPPGPPIRPA